MVIHKRKELSDLASSITQFVVSYKSCHSLQELDLCRFTNVAEIRIDSCSFQSVEEVRLVGLKKLERVEIGKKCFMTEYKQVWHFTRGKFHLRDCEQLKELKIGAYSFREYELCEIKNVPAMEVIEMGVSNDWSENFTWASLELKSVCCEGE